ncbi:MAG: DNA-protecting protein DprA [Anaerolineaceae bacterium]|nr:DNA-protecting protein DprA [Anaerolineaceae bacterium]
MSDTKYWLGFSLIHEIGPKRLSALLNYFDGLPDAWHARETQLVQAGLERQAVANLLQGRGKLDLDAEMERIHKAGARLLALADEDYPALLKEQPDAPIVLYVRGTLSPADDQALSIVGTRRATPYGRDAAHYLAKQLAAQNVTIISGLAHGIDSAAHRGALDGGGRTIAVLGNGVDRIYPRDHARFAQEISSQGAIISEFPLGTAPEARNFPRRNRVISGMALGVLVVEAPHNSGALITASIAADQGRDVFAVPGNIFNPMSSGNNRLIQEGAKLVGSVDDILDELKIVHTAVQTRTVTRRLIPSNPIEAEIAQHLGPDPLHIDDLVRLCGLPVAEVSSTLTILELKGLVRNVGAMQYCLAQSH